MSHSTNFRYNSLMHCFLLVTSEDLTAIHTLPKLYSFGYISVSDSVGL